MAVNVYHGTHSSIYIAPQVALKSIELEEPV